MHFILVFDFAVRMAKVVKECDLTKYRVRFYIKKVKQGDMEVIIL